MKLKTILLIVLAVLVCVIILQNTQVVEYSFFFWKFTISRILVIPIFILIGIVIGYVLSMHKSKKKADAS
ncbi:LapA family protein [candidate division KSB1 bacterium]|nr:LapA family protein [candidate division KSB1 bacterium]